MNFVVVIFQKFKWSVTRKVTICFVTLLIIIIASSSLVFISILNQEASAAAERQKGLALADARTFKEHLQSQLNTYSDAIYLTQQKTINSSYGLQSQDSFTRLKLDEPDRLQNPQSFLAQLDQAYKELGKIFEQLDRLLLSQNITQADQVWSKNLNLRNFILSTADQYLQQLTRENQQIIQDSEDTATFTKIIAIVAGLLGVLFTAFLAWLLSSALGRPLAVTRRHLERVSAGDFSQNLQLQNQDELGDMAKALNLSIETFRGLIESVMIGEDIEQAVTNLKLVSREQAEYVSEQASYITQVRSSMQELNKTAQTINESASEVANAAQATLSQVQTVSVISNEVSEAVRQLKQVVDLAGNRIEIANNDFVYLIEQLNKLDGQSQNTENIVQVVTNLAHQTHLLALNASIEAAGAGIMGERFGVIAQEVKQLASQSTRAAEEIRQLIVNTRQSILEARQEAEQRRSSISEVVNVGEQVEQMVHQVLEQVDSNQQTAHAILAASEKSTYQAQLIKSAAFEQQVASQQILNSVDSITESVNIGAEGSNRVAVTSSQLSVIANRLTNKLAELKLPVAAVSG
jgi:methyl-accepting chemotaxis protein